MKPIKLFGELRSKLKAHLATAHELLRPILVVDDDVATRESLAFLFKGRYQATICSSAEEGVDAFHDGVCAVILDVKMGEHDGFWVCDEIRKKSSLVPIIFYSAYQDAKDPYSVINEHRPFGYIFKDGDCQRLLAILDAAVQLHWTHLENAAFLREHSGDESPAP